MTRRKKFGPDEIVQCVMGFSGTNPDGVPVNVREGTRLRGSDEAVVRWPQFFVADGLTDGERLAAYRELAGPPTVPDDARVVRIIEQLSGPGVVEANETWSFGSRYVPKGKRFRDSDPLVRQYPDCFRPVG